MRRTILLCTAAQIALATAAHAQPAPNARPTGGSVVAGSVAITQSPTATTITQATQRAAVTWQSFDVGSQQTVQFQQPSATASTLNRVIGPDPSQIAGRIAANGQVVITNQSGVVFYQGAQVNTAGLMVSAAGISAANFMAGHMVFDQPANPNASVQNNGRITVRQAGLAALVAPQVANNGVITARLGHVVLAGARTATLDLYGDGLIAFDVTNQVVQAPSGATALVTNTGLIRADGGTVQLTARAADGIVQTLVDGGGRIRADSVGSRTGSIVLNGVGGSITVAGQLTADGPAPGSTGGRIGVDASATVTLAAGARIDASGTAGGGVVAVGTTLARAAHGSGVAAKRVAAKRTAAHVMMAAGASIAADATGRGNGGRVTLLSNQTTEMDGRISATGGPQGGDGGLVETSGPSLAIGDDAVVDAAARNPSGMAGTWLLDPLDLDVVAGAATTGVTAASGPPYSVTPSGSGSQIGNLIIERELNSGTDVVLTTQGTSGGATGNITVDAGAGIAWTSAASLTMTAAGGIILDAPIANQPLITNPAGATLILTAGGGVTQDPLNGAISVANLAVTAGGPVSLLAPNAVTTLAASVTGSGNGFAFRNDATALTVSTVGAVDGISTDGGGIALSTTTSGGITLVSGLTSGGGEVDIAVAPGNGIANFAAINSGGGPIVLLGDTLTLASEANGSVDAGSGTVVLGPATNDLAIVLGAAGGSGSLGLLSADLATITAGMLQIGYRAEDGSTSFTGGISIGSTGVTLNPGQTSALLLVTGGPGGNVSQSEPLTFTAPGGLLGVIAGGGVTLDATNTASGFAAFSQNSPLLTFSDSEPLTIGTMPAPQRGVAVAAVSGLASSAPMATGPGAPGNPLSGVTTAGPAALGVSGDLTLAANVTAPGQTVTLTAAGAIRQTGGIITTGTLAGSAGGSVGLTAANAIASIGNFTAATGFTLNNGPNLTVTGTLTGSSITIGDSGSVTVSGSIINSQNQGLSLTGSSIAITGSGLVDDGGAGTTSLTATAGSISDGGTLITGTLSGSASGTADLAGASVTSNRIATLGGFTAPSLTLTDFAPLTISGPVAANFLSITALGQMILAGDIATLGAPLSQQSGAAPAPGGSTLQVMAEATATGTLASFVQTGTVTLTDPPNTTLRIQLPGSGGTASFANLAASGANVVLALGSGTATGTLQLGGLLVIAQGGSATLTGSIAGLTTKAAAAVGRILPAINPSYTFNGCTIGSAVCGPLPPPTLPQPVLPVGQPVLGGLSWAIPGVRLPPAPPLPVLNLTLLPTPPLQAGQIAPTGVVPPNISFQDY